MRFAWIEAEKAHYPVTVMCAVLQVSRSGYYAWVPRRPCSRVTKDAQLVVEIRAAHQAARGVYGSPRVHRALRNKGRRVSRKRVERLVRREGITACTQRRFRRTTNSGHQHPVAPNVLARNFASSQPNRAWVTDVTFVWTHQGWLYLAAILDLFSRRVVGWATSASNDRALALQALSEATQNRRPEAGLLHHSDRGSVYASEDYGKALTALGAVRSMSRKGNCWDNSVAESFFSTLKAELVERQVFVTRAQARAAIGEYIEGFYNLSRLHSSIGYISPVESELRWHVLHRTA